MEDRFESNYGTTYLNDEDTPTYTTTNQND